MKRLLHLYVALLCSVLGLTTASAQTNVVVTPNVSNHAAVSIGVTFDLTSDWHISGTSFEKTINSAGVPVWSLNTVAVHSVLAVVPSVRNVVLTYQIGTVPRGTTGRILWKFNGQVRNESNFTVPPAVDQTVAAIASIDVVNTLAAGAGPVAKVHINFKEHAGITGQKPPVREGTRFILEANATRHAVIQVFPLPPLPTADLHFPLGAVTGGQYTAVFKLNGIVLAEKPFTVTAPPPPVEASVTGTFLTTSTGTLAKVRIVLPDPYYAMSAPGLPLGTGNLIKVNATLTRINTLLVLPSPKVIEQEYHLGPLAPGAYSFQYLINNSLKLTQSFQVGEPPTAPLRLAFVEVRHAATGGGHVAEVGVIITDPNLTVANWGTVRREGAKFTANISTGPRQTVSLAAEGDGAELANHPLVQAQAFVAAPGEVVAGALPVRIERFRYELGVLEVGTYSLEVITGGKPIGLREFRIQTTPPHPSPMVAAIEIFKTSTGVWKGTVRVVLSVGQTVTQWGEPKLEGKNFKVSLTVGPAAPVPADGIAVVARPLESFTYMLGTLAEGTYSLAVCLGENQLALRHFIVGANPPPPVPNQPHLAFIEVKHGEASTAAEVGVMLPQPGFAITSWGDIVRDGNQLKATIQVAVAEVAAAVIMPPKLERHAYSLGALAAGEYKLTISYQTAAVMVPKLLGARTFVVVRPPAPPTGDPLPLIAFIVDGTNEQGSFIDLGLAWPVPGFSITDWGTPVKTGSVFKSTLVIGKSESPSAVPKGPPIAELELIPADGNVNEAMVAPAREIGGWPTSLVRHRYLLGTLPAGDYHFAVAIGSKVLAQRAFTVRDAIVPKPVVTAAAEPVRRAGTEAAPFSLTFTARPGWLMDPTLGVVTVKGPHDFSTAAKRLGGGIVSLDPLGIVATGQYELAPPGGAWDSSDNGRYDIFIDPAAVKDRQGQSPLNPVGHLIVQILPTPPPVPTPLKAEVSLGMADGRWTADVAFENTGGWSQAQWGEARLRGAVFFASAALTKAPTDSLAPVPADFSHRYVLGELKPGHYSFVFRSSAGRIGHALLTVPGLEPPNPFEAWKFNVLGSGAFTETASADSADTDSDGQSTLAEFVLGGNPNAGDNLEYQARVLAGPSGAPHLALTFRRASGSESSVTANVEMSSDLKNWLPGGSQIEITSGPPELDGTQTVTARQTVPLVDSRYPYLRLRFEKTGN